MTEHDSKWLWDRWIDLWNGDLDRSKEIISTCCNNWA
jgi:hypothetical protein